MAQNKHVVIYTDGACSGNPGPGGFGIILQYGEHRKEISKGFPNTTNNRMELLGVITALEALKTPCTVDLYSDSKYVIDAIQRAGRSNGAQKIGCAHPKNRLKIRIGGNGCSMCWKFTM